MADPQSKMEVTHTIAYVLDGFPGTTTIAGATADQLRQVVDRLKGIGAVPPIPAAAPAPSAPPPADAEHICPHHGTALKLRKGNKNGKPYKFWSCPEQDDDGEWCRYTER